MECVNLTDCEKIVMKCVWDAGCDISLVEIMAALKEKYDKDWKRQTVSTFLLHLIRKGFLTSYRIGRVFYYHQEIELEAFKKQRTKEFLDFWYDGSAHMFVSALQKNGRLTEEDARSIKQSL